MKYAMIALSVTVVCSMVACSTKNTENILQKHQRSVTTTLSANYVAFSSLSEMESAADVIVIGIPQEDFENRKHINTFYADGYIQDFYTVTTMEVSKVLKGD